jgi:PKD repeat protein
MRVSSRGTGRGSASARGALRAIAATGAVACALLVGAGPAFGSTTAASFSYSPALPAPGQAVTFTSTSLNAWLQGWDLDADGQFDDGFATTATRTFSASGSYTVRLGVLGTDRVSAVAARTIVVDRPPVASLELSPASPVAGQAVTLSSTSSDADGTVTALHWDLDGDGGYDDATGSTAKVTFPSAGTYTVGLRATDDKGATGAATRTLAVAAAPVSSQEKPATPAANVPPVVGFAVSGGPRQVGDVVAFTSTSFDPDGTVARLDWDLDGDGSFGDRSGAAAQRAFTLPGAHVVGLRVTDDAGASAVAFATVEVSDVPTLLVGPEPGLRWLTPFPVVSLQGTAGRFGARISRLTVLAPVGARIELRCSGRRCPARTLVKAVRGAGATATVRLRSLERQLPAGTVIGILVTEPGRVGKSTTFRIRRSKVPLRTDGCVMPGARSAARCPR